MKTHTYTHENIQSHLILKNIIILVFQVKSQETRTISGLSPETQSKHAVLSKDMLYSLGQRFNLSVRTGFDIYL